MGIKGIYHEIGPGERIALTRLAVETYESKGRPLRLAIDISIWLFQIQSGKGGTNPALRTFYYRLLRLISHSIHPLFVFDGPNKPPFKRGKRTGPNIASIPEFLAKQLLKQFALPFHIAPGEAEAECALLQKEGIVDAVLSEDVDTLMFGSGLTLRNWSPEGSLKTKIFTHVNMYDAEKTKAGKSGLDREGMILVALMSGGDYIPEGIPGCGPKTACEAARAGFGRDLCMLSRNDVDGIAKWKERLMHELKTNESKMFRSKHKALVIPDDFPRRDVLRYYTHPCVSSAEKVATLRQSLQWDQEIDIVGLRTFVGEAFDWICVSGAKKFIRNLAPALLVKRLRLRAENGGSTSDDTYVTAIEEAQLIKTIHLKRQHVTTDGMTELRVGFIPINLVNIDLDVEEPDPELPEDENESDEDEDPPGADADNPEEQGESKKARAPSAYDPTTLEKIWILETFVKVGVPLKMQDWEESFRNAKKYLSMKSMTKRAEKNLKGSAKGGMQAGALDRYTKVTKPGINSSASKDAMDTEDGINIGSQAAIICPMSVTIGAQSQEISQPSGPSKPVFRVPPSIPLSPTSFGSQSEVVDLSSSPQSPQRKKRILRRSQSDTSALKKSKVATSAPALDPISTLSQSIDSPQLDLEPIPELPSSVTMRRHRSPLRRTNTISTSVAPSPSLSSFLGEATQAIGQPPQEHPSSACSASCNLLSSHRQRQEPSTKQPSTPRKTKKTATTSSNQPIITISSSPAATTPNSKQKSIKDWLSPRADPPSPSRNTEKLTRPLSLADKCLADVPPKPVFRVPLGVAKAGSVNALGSRGGASAVGGDLAPLDQSWCKPAKSTGEVIRLRDSLAGAWRTERLDTAVGGPDGDMGGGGFILPADTEKERKRKRAREWRVSQVEVLDLT